MTPEKNRHGSLRHWKISIAHLRANQFCAIDEGA